MLNLLDILSKNIFDRNVKSKLSVRVNFIIVLSDGSTDAAIVESNVFLSYLLIQICFNLLMAFFALKDVPSQVAVSKGIETATREAFIENDLSHLMDRMMFFTSDGTSIQ